VQWGREEARKSVAMRARSFLAWLVVAAACVCAADGLSDRGGSRIAEVRKWEAAARRKASSAAKTFLEESERVGVRPPGGAWGAADAIAASRAPRRAPQRPAGARSVAPAVPRRARCARRAAPRPPTAAPRRRRRAPQSLVVPVGVEVFLIGFDGRGGYAYQQDAKAVLNLLNSGITHHCPHSLESKEELGVCFQINYQVLGPDDLGEEVRGGGCCWGEDWGLAQAAGGSAATRSHPHPTPTPPHPNPTPGAPPAARHRGPHAHPPEGHRAQPRLHAAARRRAALAPCAGGRGRGRGRRPGRRQGSAPGGGRFQRTSCWQPRARCRDGSWGASLHSPPTRGAGTPLFWPPQPPPSPPRWSTAWTPPPWRPCLTPSWSWCTAWTRVRGGRRRGQAPGGQWTMLAAAARRAAAALASFR
jgi:hypothetical protein